MPLAESPTLTAVVEKTACGVVLANKSQPRSGISSTSALQVLASMRLSLRTELVPNIGSGRCRNVVSGGPISTGFKCTCSCTKKDIACSLPLRAAGNVKPNGNGRETTIFKSQTNFPIFINQPNWLDHLNALVLRLCHTHKSARRRSFRRLYPRRKLHLFIRRIVMIDPARYSWRLISALPYDPMQVDLHQVLFLATHFDQASCSSLAEVPDVGTERVDPARSSFDWY